jgi:hypothetical protein
MSGVVYCAAVVIDAVTHLKDYRIFLRGQQIYQARMHITYLERDIFAKQFRCTYRGILWQD